MTITRLLNLLFIVGGSAKITSSFCAIVFYGSRLKDIFSDERFLKVMKFYKMRN
jgi:hypothetical protein